MQDGNKKEEKSLETAKVIETEEGEAAILIPQSLIKELGWQEGCEVEVEVENVCIKIYSRENNSEQIKT
jgi:antitoxin component of MazEF toxin-antitoxin module